MENEERERERGLGNDDVKNTAFGFWHFSSL